MCAKIEIDKEKRTIRYNMEYAIERELCQLKWAVTVHCLFVDQATERLIRRYKDASE